MPNNPLTVEELADFALNKDNKYPRRRFLVSPDNEDGIFGWYDVGTYVQTLIDDGDIDPGTGPGTVTWISLVTGYNAEPTLFATIASGDVYLYTYSPSTTYYRHIASDLSEDAFYENFDGTNLTDLLVTKEVAVPS
jgi:hypothetical protein